MKTIRMLGALLAGALVATQAQAQQPGESYLGLGFGSVWSKGASPYTNTQDEDTSAGYKVYAGRLWGNYGMEFGLYGLGKYDVAFNNAKIADSKTNAIVASGVYVAPIATGYTFHAKLGLAFTQHQITCEGACVPSDPQLINTKKRGLSGVLGLGVGVHLAQDIAVRMEFEHIGNVHHAVGASEYRDSYDMFSVSVQFNF